MYCTCSNNGASNYSVVGLCDVRKSKKFRNITSKEAWTEISVPEALVLPECKPNIEKIDKVYITAEITSTKLINTPIVPTSNTTGQLTPNAEGQILTGKKLLVDGFLCQTIVYTAAVPEQAVYTVKFNVPFCTFIVIPRNSNIDIDKFCVTPCIEDVFISLINCRTLFKNVTLFLYAERINLTCPNGSNSLVNDDCFDSTIKNAIEIRDLEDSLYMTIRLNTSTKEFMSNAPGRGIDPPPASMQSYLTFNLFQSDGTTLITTEILPTQNISGGISNFVNKINSRKFDYNQILELTAELKSKVKDTTSNSHIKINNVSYIDNNNRLIIYPEYRLKISRPYRFKITPEGLVALQPL